LRHEFCPGVSFGRGECDHTMRAPMYQVKNAKKA
jgi:hypothetical protein